MRMGYKIASQNLSTLPTDAVRAALWLSVLASNTRRSFLSTMPSLLQRNGNEF